MHFLIFAFGALFTSTLAAPSSSYTYARHEKRNNLPPGWVKDQRLPGHEILPMRIGLAQSNLDKAEQYLMEVSHPDSPKYGQHWTAKQIAETFAASQESVDGVTEWLKNSGIAPERIRKSQSLGWLHFNATVAEAEDLLKTEYYCTSILLQANLMLLATSTISQIIFNPTSTLLLPLFTSTQRSHKPLCRSDHWNIATSRNELLQ